MPKLNFGRLPFRAIRESQPMGPAVKGPGAKDSAAKQVGSNPASKKEIPPLGPNLKQVDSYPTRPPSDPL